MKLAYIQMIVSMLIYGSVGIFAKLIPLASSQIVFMRTVVGTLIIFTVILLKKDIPDKKILKKNLKILIPSGLLMGLNWIFFLESQKYTNVSIGTLIYSLAPVMVILTSPIFLKEKLTKEKIIGVSFAMLGMILINGTGVTGIDPKKGMIYGLISATLYAIMIILNKRYDGISGMTITLGQLFFASISVTTYMLITEQIPFKLPTGRDLFLLLTVCVVHTAIASFLFFNSIKDLPGQSVALLTYLEPVSALFYSGVFLSERLSILQLVGAVCIIGGALFAEMSKKKEVLLEEGAS